MRLENKVAIITGGASGIGLATAKIFAKEGAKVVITDINEQRLLEATEEIHREGGIVESILSDVRLQKDNDAMFALAIEKFGKFDILVCNAGIIDAFTMVGHMTDEIWDKTFDINVKAPMMQMRYAVKYFEEHGGGNIITVASAAGLGGGRSGAAYTASKRAVIGLAQNTAFAYAKKGIRVNVIAPGGVATNIMETSPAIDEEGNKIFHVGMCLMPRVGQPSELADVALFLAGDESKFVNGVVIPVDGGWNAF
ncbi:MAG: glucose 1-dehydrogenase [Paludibacter sp.]|nr:glucose 1-dehydrogenase [Paludibacter sp.]